MNANLETKSVTVNNISEIASRARVHEEITYLESTVNAAGPQEVRFLAETLQKTFLGDSSIIVLIARDRYYLHSGIAIGLKLENVYDSFEIKAAMEAAVSQVDSANLNMGPDEIVNLAISASFAAARGVIFGENMAKH
ncbi:MAG: hypothetical protein LBE31_05000 [Deltaproteobacteria bacterium]|nr:hypothetical protein [Deltaproteobacteria bacterium]